MTTAGVHGGRRFLVLSPGNNLVELLPPRAPSLPPSLLRTPHPSLQGCSLPLGVLRQPPAACPAHGPMWGRGLLCLVWAVSVASPTPTRSAAPTPLPNANPRPVPGNHSAQPTVGIFSDTSLPLPSPSLGPPHAEPHGVRPIRRWYQPFSQGCLPRAWVGPGDAWGPLLSRLCPAGTLFIMGGDHLLPPLPARSALTVECTEGVVLRAPRTLMLDHVDLRLIGCAIVGRGRAIQGPIPLPSEDAAGGGQGSCCWHPLGFHCGARWVLGVPPLWAGSIPIPRIWDVAPRGVPTLYGPWSRSKPELPWRAFLGVRPF